MNTVKYFHKKTIFIINRFPLPLVCKELKSWPEFMNGEATSATKFLGLNFLQYLYFNELNNKK